MNRFWRLFLLFSGFLLCLEVPSFAQKNPPPARSKNSFSSEDIALFQNLSKKMPAFQKGKKKHLFSLRLGPKPPHLSGIHHLKFPPSRKLPRPPKLPPPPPLKILSYRPTGAPNFVDRITVSFNQPMIPLKALGKIERHSPFMKISPKLKGSFVWLGTSTLSFRLPKPFPFATHFVIKIPRGIRSLRGSKLTKTFTFSFTTPRLLVHSFFPHQNSILSQTPLFALRFNQRIDPHRLLSFIHLEGEAMFPFGPRRLYPLTSIPPSQWKKLNKLPYYARHWPKTHTLILRPLKKLRRNTKFRLVIKHGAPSAEGPLKSLQDYFYSFRTFAPLKVIGIYCTNPILSRYIFFKTTNYHHCHPNSDIYIKFNNKLASQKISKYISVHPPVQNISPWNKIISLSDDKGLRPSTNYLVTVHQGIRDIYGQKLWWRKKAVIRIGSKRPYLQVPAGKIVVLSHKTQRSMSVMLRNVPRLRERMINVPFSRLFEFYTLFKKVNYGYFTRRRKDPLSGLKVDYNKSLSTHTKPNRDSHYTISPHKVLKGREGTVFVLLSAGVLGKRRWSSPHRALLLQSTSLGLTLRYDLDKLILLATDLATGKPLSGVQLELRPFSQYARRILWRGKTNRRGLAILKGRRSLKVKGPYLLLARQHRSKAFLIIWGGGSGRIGYLSDYRSRRVRKTEKIDPFIFSEKNVYKLGETLHIRGIFRRQILTPFGGLRRLHGKAVFHYILRSPRGQLLKRGKLTLDRDSSFHLAYKIPLDGDLGYYRLSGSLRWKGHFQRIYKSFSVKAYRKPEYKVSVIVTSPAHFFGQKARWKIQGRYFFGAPMSNARLRWNLRQTPTSFRPPHQPPGFFFGESLAHIAPYFYRRFFYPRFRAKKIASGHGNLDKNGTFSISHHLVAPKKSLHANFILEAEVFGKNHQSVAARTSLLAHASSLFIGLRFANSLVKKNKPLKIDIIAVSRTGKRLSGYPIEVKAYRSHEFYSYYIRKKSLKKKKKKYLQHCRIISDQKVKHCTMRFSKVGYYIIEATGKDKQGRWTKTSKGIYIFGSGLVAWKFNKAQKIGLVSDKKLYHVGDKVKILIQSPFARATGLLSIERNGIAQYRTLQLNGSARTVNIRIRKEYLPNIHVSVILLERRSPRKAKTTPKFAFGTLSLKVSLRSKRLQIAIHPNASTLRPNSLLKVKFVVKDAQRHPVPATLIVALVDEAVLSLTHFSTPNPLAHFYRPRPQWAVFSEMRAFLFKKMKKKRKKIMQKRSPHKYRKAERLPPSPVQTTLNIKRLFIKSSRRRMLAEAPKAKRAMPMPPSPAPRTPALRMRSKFMDTAFYKSALKTNRHGEAFLKIRLPDNLTTFRLMVIALDREMEDRFGHAQTQITVRKPLLLRPALPRFANYGDRFEASVIITNTTNKDGEVHLLARGQNIQFLGDCRRKFHLKAGESYEVHFPVKTVESGIVRFQFAAQMGHWVDAVEKSLPVLIPATTEAVAVYGTTTKSIIQRLHPPKNAFSQFGGIQISFSSTALTGLQDAVRYLVEYPFECNEQTASRLIPIFTLKTLLPAFHIGKVSNRHKLDVLAKNGLKKLLRSQRYDGGWGYWGHSRHSWLWISAYVTNTLLLAQKSGYSVPRHSLIRALNFLRRRLRYPYRWERRSYATQVIALWVLAKAHRAPSYHFNRLYKHLKELPLFAKALLMSALHYQNHRDPRIKTILRLILNRAYQTPSAVHFSEYETTSEQMRLLMHSNDRTDAIILASFLDVQPRHFFIPKIARGLIQSRINGRWSTTQANAFAMIALVKYFNFYEKTVPNFVLHRWLGQAYLGSTLFKGRSMKILQQNIPLSFLIKQGASDLFLQKQGKGRLYYRIGMRYAPRNFTLSKLSRGFIVKRRYEPLEKGQVFRGKDGRWKFRLGSYVKVHLKIIVPSRRYFAAIIDPLPAGLEIVDLSFKTSAISRLRGKIAYRWNHFPYDHQEKRDSMLLLFATRLPAGVYTYSYLARATTRGSFIIPPTRAEELYHPEVFGRSSSSFGDVIP